MKLTRLNANQVGRGMKELRDSGIIEPVERTTAEGYRRKNRSNFGFIAHYRFTKHVWNQIQKENLDVHPALRKPKMKNCSDKFRNNTHK